jgi:hypothetical protein
MFRNWRCYTYSLDRVKGNYDYSYQDLKEYFNIDGSERVKCIKNFGSYEEGYFYNVGITHRGFLIY